MNTENLEYLKNTLKYLGFGEKLNDSLEAAVKEGKPSFQIGMSNLYELPNSKKEDPLTKDYITYELNFNQGKNEMYFLNNYTASLESPAFGKASQTFYIDKSKGVTAKEAYNLLSGRAVYKNLVSKEGNNYNAFIQLDLQGEKTEKGNHKLQSYHDNYGFDLEKTVSNYPIKELDNNETKTALINSLEKGNLQKINTGSGDKLYAHTSPVDRSLKFFDSELKQIELSPKTNIENKAEAAQIPTEEITRKPGVKR